MRKKNLLGAYLVLSLLASCQQKENLQHMGDELKLSLQASVYAPSNSSRIVTDESGVTNLELRVFQKVMRLAFLCRKRVIR